MHYGAILLLLLGAAVAMDQSIRRDTPGPDIANVGMKQSSPQDNPLLPPLADMRALPLELKVEIVKRLDIEAILAMHQASPWLDDAIITVLYLEYE
ncbi:hypothetical protein H4R35_003232, partial [Dimargaris xerosporica]